MTWLVRGTDVLATVEIADSFTARLRGLIARPAPEGALLLRPAFTVHTLGVRYPIDVAYCTKDLTVLRVVTLRPYRFDRPVLNARAVIEAEAGAFERWRLAVGDELEIKGADDAVGSGGPPPGAR
jgi:uncharacterized membrane protein (UPF0127 family)